MIAPLTLVASAYAQQQAKGVVPIAATEAEAFARSRKIAVLVGGREVPAYSGTGSLQFPDRDVAALGEQPRRKATP